jgi:hypothetical protein
MLRSVLRAFRRLFFRDANSPVIYLLLVPVYIDMRLWAYI